MADSRSSWTKKKQHYSQLISSDQGYSLGLGNTGAQAKFFSVTVLEKD